MAHNITALYKCILYTQYHYYFLLSGMSTVPTSLISTIKSDQPTGKNFSPVVVVAFTLKDII